MVLFVQVAFKYHFRINTEIMLRHTFLASSNKISQNRLNTHRLTRLLSVCSILKFPCCHDSFFRKLLGPLALKKKVNAFIDPVM